MNVFSRHGQALLLAAVVGLFFTVGVHAQRVDTAYVPFLVNATATVRAEMETVSASGDGLLVWKQMTVTANKKDTLRIPILQKSTGIAYGTKRQTAAQALIRNNGGAITLHLPAQSYENAEISLYNVSGRRILQKKVTASNTATNITRRNAAAGAYLLSIRGADGSATTSRLTHNGGNMNINVTVGSENLSAASAPRLQKSTAEAEVWTIKITADGKEDTSYTFAIVAGMNPQQTINLHKLYKVKIGTQTWMTENLNVSTQNSVCYNNDTANCAIFGRLYDWETANTVCPKGWHLPTVAEWLTLINYVGGTQIAGKHLKATDYWSPNDEHKDDYWLSLLPGGYEYKGTFDRINSSGFWWTATEDGDNPDLVLYFNAFGIDLYFSDNTMEPGSFFKTEKYSVRCIMD